MSTTLWGTSSCLSTLRYQSNKTTDQRRDNDNTALRCNKRVAITIKGEAVEEDELSCHSFSEEEGSVQDFEADAEVSDSETAENALARPEDQQARHEDSFTFVDPGSLLEMILFPTKQ